MNKAMVRSHKENPLISPALEHSWYLFIVYRAEFLAFGFYYEGYTVGLWRSLVFRDRRDAWKHPRVFGLFGDATGATDQKTRRASVT